MDDDRPALVGLLPGEIVMVLDDGDRPLAQEFRDVAVDDLMIGGCVVAHVGNRAAAVVVHREAELLAGAPDGLVVGRVEGWDARARRRAGKQHSSVEPVLGEPVDLGDRSVDVVQHDLADAGAPAGCRGAEVGVREDHLGDDAVGFHLRESTVGVPVAAGVVTDDVVEGVLEGRRPRVEVVVVPGLEVRAVLGHVGAAVAVGRDHDVVLARHAAGLPAPLPADKTNLEIVVPDVLEWRAWRRRWGSTAST